jgi:hypothetical protein
MTTSTLTVTEFVLARIEEDEDKVRGIKAPFWFQNGPLDPARVRAQCAAMRKIVEESVALDGEYAGIGLSAAVRALASIWSDHLDWREEWR